MLYKRPNSKNYYVKLKHRGKIIQRSTGSSNKRDALRFQEQLRAELQAERRTSAFTFNDAARRWLKEKQHKRSIETDRMIIEWYSKLIGDFYLSEITRNNIEKLRDFKLESSSRETVNRYMALLRAILRIARDDWEWIQTIPKVPMFPREVREPRFLTESQFLALVSELPSHLAQPAWFAVSTGLRTKAIQSLQWDWINRDGVQIPAKVMKNAKWLTIPLSQTAWHVLAEVHAGSPPSSTVFVNHVGVPWTDKFTTRAWNKATARASLEGVVFHDLRHTFASWKLQAGVPEHVVMALGGWESREAFKIYARWSNQGLAEWV